MRLTCIQLAGFKSFVEPTALNFVANRTAIVGPNGCGKSNVIDAVRWVMGESSAKHLRGDAMTDVIFNGSNSRRPQGFASVELIFDNSEQRLAGQYAGFKSLAIKRRLSRDGDNQFFINGEKCRRRDVTDLFSGTGLGPRAYAIIEQGTIARLIDAKPDELRSFIEEAAGLSKYKERRRETALRMEHSQDNLARLHDIAQEVQQQIERLAGQAQAAEQFRVLKARIRSGQAQLKALQWRDLQAALSETQGQAQALSQQLAALQEQSLNNQAQQEALQEAQSQCLAAQELAHSQLAELNQAIAQHLTATAHQQAQLQLWRQQEQEIQADVAQLAGLLEQAAAEQHSRTQALETLAQAQAEQALAAAQLGETQHQITEQLQGQQQSLATLEDALQAQQNLRMRLLNQQELMAGQIQQAADQLAQRHASLIRLQQIPGAIQEHKSLSPPPNPLAQLEQQVQQLKAERKELRREQAQLAQELAYLAGRLGRREPNADWQDLNEASQLAAGPWVDTWAAAEAWLQPWISAQPWRDDWQTASSERSAPLFLLRPQADTLGIVQWLASWQSAADRAAALAALEVQPEGVFYTPNGEVFARDWLYLPASGESRFSLPGRLALMVNLRSRQQTLDEQLAALDAKLSPLQAELTRLKAQALQEAALSDYQQASLTSAEAEYQQALGHQQALDATVLKLAEQLAQCEKTLQGLESERAQLAEQIAAGTARLAELALQESAFARASEQLHMESQAIKLAAAAALPVQQRLAEQHQQRVNKLQEIGASIAQSLQQDEPLQRLQVQLASAQGQLQACKERFASGEKQLKHLVQQERQLRQHLEQLQSRQEANKLEAQTLHTQLQGLTAEAFDINAALAMLPAHADSEQLHQQLADDKNALDALGPVNLAALEEYEQACARAAYLNEQQTDLHQALECLENAIKQIDRESRQRFKQTFDGANEGLQALFPQVFAGGSAYLELVGDDLLASGVAIMARPPGKKNSTIHLLSGGEKALTALALVFALFRLNPAPFCLLDEVDAPLDDANVGRFARLVEAMAEQVQFIFITHNKIAMEMAEHLLGVTMQEPGVSRVVSVDIAHAAQLAAD